MTKYLWIATLLVLAGFLLCGCSTVNYNIDFHTGAFRVAETLTVEPGQGGDESDTSSMESAATGGTELSPGNNNVIKGFADQANIFNIGTASTPTTTTDAKASATIQSPNSQTGVGGNDGATGGTPTTGAADG